MPEKRGLCCRLCAERLSSGHQSASVPASYKGSSNVGAEATLLSFEADSKDHTSPD